MPLSSSRGGSLRAAWPWLPLWLLVATLAMFQHGPMPMFSTRTLSVAWEMWHRHSFLVPYLNGQPYSDKPPLLLWLIQLGWMIGGVGDLWPRLLELLLGAMQLLLLAALARRLFPAQPRVARAAPWILLALSYAFLFGLQVMYEVLLADCVLAALLALLPDPRRAAPRFVVFAAASGLGLLTKGPVMLLHVALPWLLGPWWNDWARQHRRRWYLRGALALLAACGMLAAWALAAAAAGGAAYRQQLLFHQTAGRMVHAFAHAQPVWWYVALLPVLLFPFALWPRLWVAVGLLRPPFAPGLRFLFAWLGPVLLVLSLVSGKQAYYLLPEYGGLALLAATALAPLRERHASLARTPWLGPWPLALLSLMLGAGLIALPELLAHGVAHGTLLRMLAPRAPGFGLIYLALGLVLLVRGRAELPRIAAVALIGAAVANTLFTATLWPAYDVAPAAAFLARAEARGQPLANLESYDGQFHFLGRLTRPIVPLHDPQALQAWARAHPDGLVIDYPAQLSPADRQRAQYVQRFRGVWLAVWPAPALAAGRAGPPQPAPAE